MNKLHCITITSYTETRRIHWYINQHNHDNFILHKIYLKSILTIQLMVYSLWQQLLLTVYCQWGTISPQRSFGRHRTQMTAWPSWKVQLPWVLLSLRSCVRKDFDCAVSDRMFCHSPLLPGELFHRQQPPTPASTSTVHYSAPISGSLPGSLDSCDHVDCHRAPFSVPYTGPCHVISPHAKYFDISFSDCSQWVSIDSLKPANFFTLIMLSLIPGV